MRARLAVPARRGHDAVQSRGRVASLTTPLANAGVRCSCSRPSTPITCWSRRTNWRGVAALRGRVAIPPDLHPITVEWTATKWDGSRSVQGVRLGQNDRLDRVLQFRGDLRRRRPRPGHSQRPFPPRATSSSPARWSRRSSADLSLLEKAFSNCSFGPSIVTWIGCGAHDREAELPGRLLGLPHRLLRREAVLDVRRGGQFVLHERPPRVSGSDRLSWRSPKTGTGPYMEYNEPRRRLLFPPRAALV